MGDEKSRTVRDEYSDVYGQTPIKRSEFEQSQDCRIVQQLMLKRTLGMGCEYGGIRSERHTQLDAGHPDPSILFSRVEKYYKKRLEEEWNGVHPMKGRMPGPQSIQMRSNDYLSLAGDERIINAEIEALRNLGHGDSISRIWIHHVTDARREFEVRIASLMGAEDSVLCTSGYCANVGLIQSLAGPDVRVYLDQMAHMSLWEGVKSAQAIACPFRHNDANHLERQIRKHGAGYVVVDALYSTDGDLCPLHDIIETAERFNCPVIVDETHSFGTHGPAGAGLVKLYGLEDRVHFRTIGLSKGVPSRGGVVICSKRNAEFFRYEALPAIFSTTVLEHEVAGYNAALDIFESEEWRRERLHSNHQRIRAQLNQLGYNVRNCKSQIISLEAGEILQTVVLRDVLEKRGIFGSLFFAPAVPRKRCLIRFTVNCSLTEAQIARFIAVCDEIRDEVKLAEWPSTRRAGIAARAPVFQPQQVLHGRPSRSKPHPRFGTGNHISTADTGHDDTRSM